MTKRDTRPGSLRGALDLLVLGILADGPAHGYAIARAIRDRSDENLTIEEGSLYPALYRIEENGWVRASWGLNENKRRVRVYAMTASGTRRLDDERQAFRVFARAVVDVVGS